MDEKLDVKNVEKHEEGTYDEETRVDTPMELENESITIEDVDQKELSIIEIPIEKPSDPPKLILKPFPSELKCCCKSCNNGDKNWRRKIRIHIDFTWFGSVPTSKEIMS